MRVNCCGVSRFTRRCVTRSHTCHAVPCIIVASLATCRRRVWLSLHGRARSWLRALYAKRASGNNKRTWNMRDKSNMQKISTCWSERPRTFLLKTPLQVFSILNTIEKPVKWTVLSLIPKTSWSAYLYPRGGGYCHIWAIQVCAAVKGIVF